MSEGNPSEPPSRHSSAQTAYRQMEVPPASQRLIARFRSRGLDAMFRHWSVGDSVFVGTGRFEHEIGITGYSRSAYVCQRNNGSWVVFDVVESDHDFTEEQAAEYVEWLLTCSQEEHAAEVRRLARHWRNEAGQQVVAEPPKRVRRLSPEDAESQAVELARRFVESQPSNGWQFSIGSATPCHLNPDPDGKIARRWNVGVRWEREGSVMDGPAIVSVNLETGETSWV